MKIGEAGYWKPCQKGIVLSTLSVLELTERLLGEGLCFLLTARLSQDKVENFFSCVRRRKANPTALEFKNAIKTISLAQILEDVKASNYLFDGSQTLIDPLNADLIVENTKRVEAFFANCPQAKSDCIELEEEEDFLLHFAVATSEIENVEIRDQAVLYNFCGYVIHSKTRSKREKLDCKDCLSALISPNAVVRDDELAALVQFRDYTGKAMIYCSSKVFRNS